MVCGRSPHGGKAGNLQVLDIAREVIGCYQLYAKESVGSARIGEKQSSKVALNEKSRLAIMEQRPTREGLQVKT